MNPLINALRVLIVCTALLVPSHAKAAVPTNGQVIISEFRVRGPNGANDEFVEIYNNTVSNITVATPDGSFGWAVAASDGKIRYIVPTGTVLPARGHYLGVNSVGYSLASYAAGNGTTATGDATYTTDIPDNAGIALFRTANTNNFFLSNRLDAVGSTSEANTLYKEGTGYPALVPFSIDYSFTRNLTNGAPRDTDNNANDLLFVDSNGTSAGAGQRLGAAGPETLSGPIRLPGGTNGVRFFLLDSNAPIHDSPNFVRDFTSDPANNSTFGTISIRRRVQNNTPNPITRLRFRVTDITTFPSPFGTTDLRPRTSSAVVVAVAGVGNVTVQGTTLEQPPSQPNGGGFNSSMSAGTVTLATPLAPGASTHVQFLLGLQQEGQVRFRAFAESLPAGTNDILILEDLDDEGVSSSDPRIWTGLGADNFWNTSANWLSNILPAAGSPLVFPAGAARLVNSNNLTAGLTFISITFTGANGGYDLRGNSIALGSGGVQGISGTNTISLPITVANSRPITVASGASVLLSNVVSGAGGLNKNGAGTLILAGAGNNTFAGNLWAASGTTLLAKAAGMDAFGGSLVIGNGVPTAILRLAAPNQIPDGSLININAGLLDLNGFNETLGPIGIGAGRLVSGPPGSGNAAYLAGNVSVTSSAQASLFEGAFILTGGATRTFTVANGAAADDLIVRSELASAGGTGLIKAGAGRMVIETNCSYIGDTTVSAGVLIMNGANTNTDVVLNGGTFGGTANVGKVSGSAGTLSPGESPGIITATNLQLLAGSTLAAEIYGTAIGSEFDRLNINGPVTLGGTLNATLGVGASQVGDIFRIINNDGVDAVTGTFAGIAEGTTTIIDGYRFRMSYAGGTGNDVTLTRLPHLNITSNNIPASGPASVYPSTITLSGITGLISRVTVTLSNFSHTYPDDVDVLLVSPTGKKVILVSDCGGSLNVTNVDLTISDSAAGLLLDAGQIISGTYRPSNYDFTETFPVPAPPVPYLNSMAAFVGDSPNGVWSLYVTDDVGGDSGSIAGGWTLDVTVGPPLDITRISGPRAVLSWPDYAVGFTVETKGALTNATWFPLATTPIANGGQYRVTNSIGSTNLFYRLVK